MSVATLSARELGTFAAVLVKLDACQLPEAVKLSARISDGNCGAFLDSYGEHIDPITEYEIEGETLKALTDDNYLLGGAFGPFAYNMVSQSGQTFVAPGVAAPEDSKVIVAIRVLEEKAHEWYDSQRRQLERAEQDAAAYNVAGQLPTVSAEEVTALCKSLGYQRIIYAVHYVDESDSMTDYFNGRNTRRVAIGFGKGKRESFKQLREAAARFEPTQHMGPGKDRVTVYAWKYDETERRMRGDACEPLRDEHYNRVEFSAEAEARQHVDAMVTQFKADQEAGRVEYPRVCEFVDFAAKHGYELSVESYENRETYSMGHGNYLGSSRYHGWQVTSQDVEWSQGSGEIEIAEFPRTPAAKASTRKPKQATATIERHETSETERGIYYHWVILCGKRRTYVSHMGNTISVSTKPRGVGNWFSSWDAAKSAYRSANIIHAIETAEENHGQLTAASPAPADGTSDDDIAALSWL